MRHALLPLAFLLLCAACGGESDDGGSGGSGGEPDAGAGGAQAGGSGGLGWGATGGGGPVPTCDCPVGTVCVAWCKGDGQTFKTACVPSGDGGCEELCGDDYPWSCSLSFCENAPKGAKFCMGA